MSENVICPAENYTFKSKSIVFGWTYDIFAHMSSRRLYLNSLLYLVYIFQIIKSNMADAHSAGAKSELMKFGTISFKCRARKSDLVPRSKIFTIAWCLAAGG